MRKNSRFWALALWLMIAPTLTWAQDESKAKILKTVEIEWEAVAGADKYQVELDLKDGQPPLMFTTREPHLVQDIPVGLYQLRIRSCDAYGEFSPWGTAVPFDVVIKEITPLSPPNKAVVVAKDKAREEVEFSWTPVDKVKEYRISLWTNELKDKPLFFTTRATKKKLSIKTGREYFWAVNFESANEVSYAQLPPKFSFTLIGSKLITPMELKALRREQNRIMQWKPTEEARSYRARLSFRHVDEKDFQPAQEVTIKGHEWNAGPLKPGVYRLELMAQAPDRADSDVAQLVFSVKPTEAELSAFVR